MRVRRLPPVLLGGVLLFAGCQAIPDARDTADDVSAAVERCLESGPEAEYLRRSRARMRPGVLCFDGASLACVEPIQPDVHGQVVRVQGPVVVIENAPGTPQIDEPVLFFEIYLRTLYKGRAVVFETIGDFHVCRIVDVKVGVVVLVGDEAATWL